MSFTALLLLTVLPYWQDIQTTSVNAQTQRTEVVYHATRDDALSKGFRECENYLDLNGVWDFKYYEDYHDFQRFFADAQNDKDCHPEERGDEGSVGAMNIAWNKIRVPGNWEVQGYGTAIYVNIPYDFCPKDPVAGVLPERFPGALYHRTFTVPEEWAGRNVFLNLCGSKSGTYVYVNGREVGYCEDSKNLARFKITDYLKKGENDLILKVFRYTQASFLECQDFWRISGEERDVYLSSEVKDTGFDFSVVSTLDEDLRTGIFRLQLRASARTEVAYELLDKDGHAVADATYAFSGALTTLTDSIPAVRRWSAETPELYTLLLKVNGEYTRFPVGFRRLEIKSIQDGEKKVKAFLVNGQPVKFKGVNLHEHNPYTGHYVTRENILEDLLLMKKANINAIRTCHYPQPREFYELCDSLGFYVYDEANIESHGMGYKPERTLGNKPEWYPKHIDRIVNMYRRTANYPCVTLLSLGNEAGNGVNFYNAYKELKALEEKGQNRPVVYERAESDWNTDLIVPQYPGAEWFRRMGEKYTERPVCPSEYSHAMGNSNGSLDWQWDAIYAHKQLQGAFIWDWVDQGLYDKERGWTYGGDYGENAPSDANFCCNGIVNPDREPHPAFYEVKHVYQNISIQPKDTENGLFTITNRHYFTDLSPYTIRYWVERDGKKPFWWRRHQLSLKTAPQESEEIRVKLPRMKRPGEYRIFFEVLQGNEIVACDEALLQDSAVRKSRTPKGQVEYAEGDTEIVVRGPKLELHFDKLSGSVKSWQVDGKELILSSFGLQTNFWRAPVDNDYGNGVPRRLERYRTPGKPLSAHARRGENGTAVIEVKGEGVRASETYTVYPDGALKVAVTTAPDAEKTEIPRLGLRFRIGDEAFFRYFGRGPVENYWDRASSSFKRIWTSTATEEYYPYVRPQENGHHTGTSWLQLGGITILSDGEFEFNVLRQTVEDLDGGLEKAQTHISDVPVRAFSEVCIDYRMTGVGGYDSWGSRPEKDRSLWSDQSYSYSFTLIPGNKTRYHYE